MFLKPLLPLLVVSSLFALTVQEFQQQQQNKFNSYKQDKQAAFESYKKEQEKAFSDYKKELSKIWEDPKLSSKKNWVSYTKDKKTRTDVDFKNEEIIIETVATSAKEAQQKLQMALAKAVIIDTKTVQETDPLEKKLAKIRKPQGMIDAKVKAEPILATTIFKQPPTQKSVQKYVYSHITPKKIQVVPAKKVAHAKIYSVKVKMPKNTTIKRSKIYLHEAKTQAHKQNIPLPLVFAIMHSESSFNPRATSHIPAYGLMQIVPKTAGIDSYNYLYKKKRLVSSSYLYDSSNNITMGSGYLHILYYSYLKSIKNPTSRMYCTIAAYNTGAGNIAYAFNRHKSHLSKKQKYRMKYAADDINALSSDEVYATLMRDLRWDEPKHYLKKVSKRMAIYNKLYGQ